MLTAKAEKLNDEEADELGEPRPRPPVEAAAARKPKGPRKMGSGRTDLLEQDLLMDEEWGEVYGFLVDDRGDAMLHPQLRPAAPRAYAVPDVRGGGAVTAGAANGNGAHASLPRITPPHQQHQQQQQQVVSPVPAKPFTPYSYSTAAPTNASTAALGSGAWSSSSSPHVPQLQQQVAGMGISSSGSGGHGHSHE